MPFFFIIPKGVKGIPFVLFFAGLALGIGGYIDAQSTAARLDTVVNIQEENYDELPYDTKFFVFDNVKVIAAEREKFPSMSYFCLCQFEDGESDLHYVRILMYPSDPHLETIATNLDDKGYVTTDVYISGTYEVLDHCNDSWSSSVCYRPDELLEEDTDLTLYLASDDMNYADTVNAAKLASMREAYLLCAAGVVVAIISAIIFINMVKAGK